MKREPLPVDLQNKDAKELLSWLSRALREKEAAEARLVLQALADRHYILPVRTYGWLKRTFPGLTKEFRDRRKGG